MGRITKSDVTIIAKHLQKQGKLARDYKDSYLVFSDSKEERLSDLTEFTDEQRFYLLRGMDVYIAATDETVWLDDDNIDY